MTTTMSDIKSAMGAEYNVPITPKYLGKIKIIGTLNRKSLKSDNPSDITGFPNDCRKMLVDF